MRELYTKEMDSDSVYMIKSFFKLDFAVQTENAICRRQVAKDVTEKTLTGGKHCLHLYYIEKMY